MSEKITLALWEYNDLNREVLELRSKLDAQYAENARLAAEVNYLRPELETARYLLAELSRDRNFRLYIHVDYIARVAALTQEKDSDA